VIELQYHSKLNKIFLFKCYWYDITNRGIKVNLHHGLVEINIKATLCNVDDFFIFFMQCTQDYYIYTPSFRKNYFRIDWLFIVKTKPKGRFQVIKDDNDEVTAGDDVFQINKLVDIYRVALSTNLQENSNFHVVENSFVHVDIEELNDVLRTNRHTQGDEDDDIDKHQFNEEDYDGHDDDKIGEEEGEEDNSD
jgi:hypothetical protein